jgi:hypothetical protein
MHEFLSLLSKIGRFLAVVLLVGSSVIALPTEVNGGTRSLTQAPLTEWVSEIQLSSLTEDEVDAANKTFVKFFDAPVYAASSDNQVETARQTKIFLSIKESLLQYHSVRFRNISVVFLV